MTKTLLCLFICISAFSYSQTNSKSYVVMTNFEVIEYDSVYISNLCLSKNFIEANNLQIYKINLHFMFKGEYKNRLLEERCLYAKTNAIVQINEQIIKKRKKKDELKKIKESSIKKIVFKNKEEAKAVYGKRKGRHGAIIIETKVQESNN